MTIDPHQRLVLVRHLQAAIRYYLGRIHFRQQNDLSGIEEFQAAIQEANQMINILEAK